MAPVQAWTDAEKDPSSAEEQKAYGVVPTATSFDAGDQGPLMGRRASAKVKSGEVLYYKQDSCIAAFASSKPFECVTLFVIALNAIWLGADSDLNHAESLKDTHIVWRLGDNFFCVYFFFEILVRFASFRSALLCIRDSWFVFDSILVTLMVLETWMLPIVLGDSGENPLGDMAILRLLRLLRLSRLARLMRSFPELTTIVKGIVAATRSVGTVLLLLCILCYVWAIIFTGIYKDYDAIDPNCEDCDQGLREFFGSIGMSMFTFICNGTLLDNLDGLITMLREDSLIMLVLFLAFILLSAFTVLNMLIGILCDVISATEKAELEKTKLDSVKETFTDAFMLIDKDGSGKVSGDEFDAMCRNGPVMKLMEKELGLDKLQLMEMKTLLFSDASGEREMTFDDFLKLLLRLRPEEHAGPLDVQQFQKILRDQDRRSQRNVDHLLAQVERIKASRNRMASKSASVGGSGGERATPKPSADGATELLLEDELERMCREASVEEILEELQFRMPDAPSPSTMDGVIKVDSCK